MVSPATDLPVSFMPKPTPGEVENVRWVVPLGTYIYGNPTVAGGRVVVGSGDRLLLDDPRFKRTRGGMVHCLDEKTGEVIWRLVTPMRPKHRLPEGAHYGQQHIGTCSSAAIVDRRAYLMTSACEIICLDMNGLADGNNGTYQDEARYMAGHGNPPVKLTSKDADILWVFDMVDELDVCPHDVASCSPLVHDGVLYTVTSNGVDGPHKKCLRPDAPSFIALDAKTGRLLATDAEGVGHRNWHALWSPPSLGEVNGRKLVFFGGADGICYAFEALTSAPEKPIHFTKVWQYDCNPPGYRRPDGKPIDYYVGDKRKKYSTNKNDGKFLGPSQIISTPVFHEGRVYVTIGQDPMHGRGRGLLHCIDASKTGDITESGCVWSYDAIERSIASVAIADGLLYAVDVAGRVHCLEAATGEPLWLYETGSETWATPLVADGKVFIGNKRRLEVFATGREPRLLAEISLGTASYGTPVAVNNTLFVASLKKLWAVETGADLPEPPAQTASQP